MKTGLHEKADVSTIVRIADASLDTGTDAPAEIVKGAARSRSEPPEAAQRARARAFAEPLLLGQVLDTGEDVLAHADGVAGILDAIGAAPPMLAAAYLVYAGDFLNRPEEIVTNAFGASQASLVMHTRKLVQIQRAARGAQVGADRRTEQTERVRKMLLAFSRDLRVVLLRLASRLQTLRFFAATKLPCPEALSRESLQVFAPLANRLGIWQIKWEIEDLAFRFLQPEQYRQVADLLHERRVEREAGVEAFRQKLSGQLNDFGIHAQVLGRPKHLYSIWKKMQGKGLEFARVFDIRAMRVIVDDVPSCYATLGRVHELYRPVFDEYSDYIARPKPNGYQSLHTVVQDEGGRPVEVQIRTREMDDHAEHGVAAHWVYKEAGGKGYAGASADSSFDAQVAEARKAVLRQLLEWERDFVTTDDANASANANANANASANAGSNGARPATPTAFDDRIYVFTPQASVVELPVGATPIDFAYAVHTDLGHRCRGAKVDGAMVPLNTALHSGETVEITATKEGGPSLDWLNDNLGYLRASRSKTKVRAWFNGLATAATVARGREAVEKVLQREGKTSMRLEDLAGKLGFPSADALFDVVGKDEFSLRNIEILLRPAEPVPTPDEVIALKRPRPDGESPRGGVLVVGVESLLTTLSKCCRPAPPDAITGYVTRGRGVAIHRRLCSAFREMAARSPERVIEVEWGARRGDESALYPVDVMVQAADRQGLLRDISEVFAKEGMNVTGVRTQSTRDSQGGSAAMTFTIEVADAARLNKVLQLVERIPGVRSTRRK